MAHATRHHHQSVDSELPRFQHIVGNNSLSATSDKLVDQKSIPDPPHRKWLADIATRAMIQAEFRTTFERSELDEVDALATEAHVSPTHEARPDHPVHDAHDHKHGNAHEAHVLKNLEHLPWVSIDNDDTRDIDQISATEEHADGTVTLHVGIADVLIARGCAIDLRAAINTTTVYTPAQVFTMLPERMCYDLTSLKPDVGRQGIVVSVRFASASNVAIQEESICLARVVNKGKCAYNGVSAWLDGGAPPEALVDHEDLQHTIRLQVGFTSLGRGGYSNCNLTVTRLTLAAASHSFTI